VTLSWKESTDNAPTVGIQYELQVAKDGGFINIEAQLFSPAGTSNYATVLTVDRDNKYWRVRARDIGGNLSAWSAPLTSACTTTALTTAPATRRRAADLPHPRPLRWAPPSWAR
jgi:hypothetical protein